MNKKRCSYQVSMLVAFVLVVVAIPSSLYFANVECDLGMWPSLATFVFSAFFAVYKAASRLRAIE